jgi:hypothetical protein
MTQQTTPAQVEAIKVDRAMLQRRLVGAGVALLGAIALGGFNAWYINHVEEQSQRELCSFVVALSDAYRSRPPGSPTLTDTGQRIYDSVEDLRRRYGCDRQ